MGKYDGPTLGGQDFGDGTHVSPGTIESFVAEMGLVVMGMCVAGYFGVKGALALDEKIFGKIDRNMPAQTIDSEQYRRNWIGAGGAVAGGAAGLGAIALAQVGIPLLGEFLSGIRIRRRRY